MSFAESFTALETLLPCLIYPVCYHSELEAVLDCNLEDRTCLPTVHCIYCGYNAGAPTIQHELEAIQQLLSGETSNLAARRVWRSPTSSFAVRSPSSGALPARSA